MNGEKGPSFLVLGFIQIRQNISTGNIVTTKKRQLGFISEGEDRQIGGNGGAGTTVAKLSPRQKHP